MSRHRRFSHNSALGCAIAPLSIVIAIGVFALAPSSLAQAGLDLEGVVRSTLERNTSILYSIESVRIREAELQVAEGAFDTVVGLSAEGGRTSRLFSDAEQAIYHVPSAHTGTSSYRLAASRLTRAGVTIASVFEVSRRDALTLGVSPIIQNQAALQLSLPVLNVGRRTPQASDVASAERALQASMDGSSHARAEGIYHAVMAYWAYLGSFESLQILSDSEKKANRLLEETRALVEGGERASSDLDQLRADLADRFAARLAAEQRLVEARQRLGMEMGLRAAEAAVLPQPSSVFPSSNGLPAIPYSVYDALASSRRHDLAGAAKAVDAAARARIARRLETLPKLDLRFSLGFTGLSENRLTLEQHLPPFGQNHISGANGTFSIVLELPISNRRALGRFQRQHSVWRQAQLAHEYLERHLRSDLRVATQQLRTSITELAKVEEAVSLYAAAVENERRKLQLGMSTQFDLILVEERLRNSQLARVAARVHYAGAISRLKYETGTLVAEHDTADEIVKRLSSPAIGED